MTGRREAPGVRVTLLAHEKAASGERINLDGRVLGFSFEDSDKKTDKATLQLDNFDLSLFDRPELVNGATIEVSWGYPGNMSPPRRVVLKKLKGFDVLNLEGQATSVLLNQHARTRAWKGKTRSDVVREVAAEHGYEGQFLDVEDTVVVLDTINQAAETDARFLKRLAAREAFDFFVDDQGLHWRSRKQSGPPTHVLTWFSDPGCGDVLSVSVESDLTRRVGRVDVRARAPLVRTKPTAYGRVTRRASSDPSCIRGKDADKGRFSFRKAPWGRKENPHARVGESVARTLGMQIPYSHHTEV